MNEYFKLEVNVLDHPKLIELSDAAFRVWVASIAYANRLMTDGVIAPQVVRRLHDCDFGDSDDTPEQHAKELAAAGLWEPVEGGGWVVHDFLDHNTSRAERLRKRAAETKRKADYRAGKKGDGTDDDPPPDVPPGHPPMSHRDSVSPSVGTPADGDNVSLARVATTETEATTEAGLQTVVAPLAARPVSVDRQVFDFWREARAKNGTTVFNDARKRVVSAALKAYPLDDVLDAIRGIACDPWPERPDHDDLIVVLRLGGRGNRNNLEHFRDLARDGPRGRSNGKVQRQLNDLQQLYDDMERMRPGGTQTDDLGRMGSNHPQTQRQLP